MRDKNYNTLISVILPVYNAEKYLAAAIESILTQEYSHFELILINDGSTDGSAKIMEAFHDKRIVLLTNEANQGLIFSLNRGLSAAKGEFIARMDADDISMPDRFSKQLDYFRKYPESVVVGSGYDVLKDGKIRGRVHGGENGDYLKGILLFSTCFCHPAVMIRNIFRESGIAYEPAFLHAEDYRLWTQLASKGAFYNINEPLLKYRHHGGQISARHKEMQLAISAQIRRDHLKTLGFNFNEAQFGIHNFIGNNTFIRSLDELLQIEKWLLDLLEQNSKIKAIALPGFNLALHKYWLDSCGNTSLGLSAYRLCFRSPLAGLSTMTLKTRLILLAKCAIRKFR